MTQDTINNIKTLLSTPKNCVIVPHKNPDGDAMGSTLALYQYLKKYNHNAVVITPNDYPEFLKWLPYTNTVLNFEIETEKSQNLITNADVLFTLDFNALHRAGLMEQPLTNSKAIKIMIDHHQQPDDYATYMYSNSSMSSTCEMVFNFFNMLSDKHLVDVDIATCLYTGIVTDTGSFKYPSTTSNTHDIVSTLLEKGANNFSIHQALFDTNSISRIQLLGCALNNLKVLSTFNTAYISLSQKELDTFNFKKGDTEGFVNYGLSIKGICFAVIFIENKQEGIIKISFRSKGDFSVNTFARNHFNGGGHTNAAGGKSETNLQETINHFISLLPEYKDMLNA